MVDFDETDLKILLLLKKDSQITLKDLEQHVNIKISSIHNRIKKLTNLGIIKNYSINIDHNTLGFPLSAFIMLYFDKTETKLDQVEVANSMSEFARIEEIHLIAGEYDILLKVKARSIEDLGIFVTKELKQIPGIGGSRTFISLIKVKDNADEPYLIEDSSIIETISQEDTREFHQDQATQATR